MSAKKKAERTKPSRSDAPTCWPLEWVRQMPLEDFIALQHSLTPEWIRGVSVRLYGVLANHSLANKDAAIEALNNGTIQVGKTRGFGKKTDAELRSILGLPMPGKDRCPCCGQIIRRANAGADGRGALGQPMFETE